MTVLEFWGCTFITFGPALVAVIITVAPDPLKVILLISACFFWLISFLIASVFWSMISQYLDYIVIGALLAVLSQEAFRCLFHMAASSVQIMLIKLLGRESSEDKQSSSRSSRANSSSFAIQKQLPMSYVSGLGFGIMNGCFSLMNVLTDYLGPGTVGLQGDSPHFLLVSSLTALAFIILNVSWSVIMSESIEKSDRKLGVIVLVSHLIATTATLLNRVNLQILSILIVYSITIFCCVVATRWCVNPKIAKAASNETRTNPVTATDHEVE